MPMPKRTYQPKKRRRARRYGFLNRGKNVIASRRKKGRKKLSAA